MRDVLYVESSGDIIGGGQISLLGLMQGLDPARYVASCVCPDKGSMPDAVRRACIGVQVEVLPRVSLRFSVAACVWRLCRMLRNEDIALIHANSLRSMFYAGIAGRLLHIPVVWHVRVSGSDGLWDRLLAALATRIIVISHAVRQRFTGFVPTRRLHTIYNGEDLRRHTRATGESIRREAESEEGHLVGMVARLSEEKDHETYLKAAALIAERLPQAKFLIVGEDLDPDKRLRRHIECLVQELRLSENVIMAGHRSDIPSIMAGLDVLVHCVHSEGFGRVLIEAMAAGTPVVATAVGGIPEVVKHEHTGLLVGRTNVKAVADAVLGLLEDPARCHRMGEAGRELIARRFSLTAHVAQVQALYDEILGLGQCEAAMTSAG